MTLAPLVATACHPQEVRESSTVGTNGQVGQVKLRNVHLRATEEPYRPGGNADAVLHLFNQAHEQDALVDVRSPQARNIVLRWDRGCDGHAEAVPRIPVTAAGTVPAAPEEPDSASPYYLEVRELTQLTRPGTTFPITFTFERAGEVTLDAKVEATRDGDQPPPSPCTGQPPAPASTAPTPTGEPPAGSTDNHAITVTGTVERADSGDCLLLADEGRPYVLLGGDPSVVRPGADLVVHGRLAPEASICAHGAALRVLEAVPE
ncbi:copper chaperone PCu(A)C [Parasphingorhabdus pacifica]